MFNVPRAPLGRAWNLEGEQCDIWAGRFLEDLEETRREMEKERIKMQGEVICWTTLLALCMSPGFFVCLPIKLLSFLAPSRGLPSCLPKIPFNFVSSFCNLSLSLTLSIYTSISPNCLYSTPWIQAPHVHSARSPPHTPQSHSMTRTSIPHP